MARFRFRLAALERLREMTRDELRGRLAEAYEAEQILARQRATVDAESNALVQTRRQIVGGGAVDVTRLLETQRHQLMLQAQSRTLAEQAARLADEVERRRLAVIEADRELQVLDKLRRKRQQEHRAAEESAEGKRLDEIATMRWRAPDR